MIIIRLLGSVVTTLPIGPEHPGIDAGPGFELVHQVGYLLPHKEAARVLMEERLRDARRSPAAAGCSSCSR